MIENSVLFNLIKELNALPTPCNDVIYYPDNLVTLGNQGVYSVFQTLSRKSGLAYIAITHPDTTKLILAGSKDSMSELYKSIPWPEYEIIDENHMFYYKTAPTFQALEDYFNKLKKQ